MKKSTKVLLIGGALAVAAGAAVLMMGSGEAKAAPLPPGEPGEPDEEVEEEEETDEDTEVDEIPPGELPAPDDSAPDDSAVPHPPDIITIDPREVELPPTPVDDGGLLDRVVKELPKVLPKPAPTPKQPAPAPLPQLPSLPGLPPPVIEAPADEVDPVTQAMVEELLVQEHTPNWKQKSAKVAAWQRMRGLTVDERFGPGSARVLAQETGLIPIVRFWPKAAGANPKRAIDAYKADLLTMAQTAESPRREHLLRAIDREQGQGFGTPPKPITTTIEFAG
jgi:hypothetical protein